MDPAIESALAWFKRIYLDGIPVLLRQNETAFLSFLCVVAATDALAGYRYDVDNRGERFQRFVTEYFPPGYRPHAEQLYRFRCRMLHNFSPAYFSLQHAVPQLHLQGSEIGDTVLSDESFFAGLRSAAERYFAQLVASAQLQADMLARLKNLDRGGAVYVSA
jgi:hypothetical protein